MSYASSRHNARASRRSSANKQRLLFAGAVKKTTKTNPSGDGSDDSWWVKSGTRPTRNGLGPVSSRRPQGVWSHRGNHTIPLVFGVETVLWPTAAKKGGKWYRRVVEAAECFMARYHTDEVESTWFRHAAEMPRAMTKRNGGDGGAAVLISLWTNAKNTW